MTVSSTVRRAGPYVGNGVTTSFPFEFKVFADEEVYVVLADLDSGAESVLVLTSDYTVSLNPDQDASPGGSVVYAPSGVPMAATHSLTITSNVPQSQTLDLTNGGGFFPSVINSALDRVVILVQQLSEQLARAVKVSISSSISPEDYLTQTQQNAATASSAASTATSAAASVVGVVDEAEDARDAAQKWATEDEDVQVDDGVNPPGYSAYHWAQKAEQSVIGSDAASVSFDPAGDIAATNVQDAIEELDSEKAASSHSHVIGDVTDLVSLMPGALLDFAGTSAPAGTLLCNGANVSRATYAALFTAIGVTWGAGDGSTTFTLPDFRRRVAVGSGGSGSGTLGNAVGNVGGAETVTLTATEMPTHTHTVTDPGHTHASAADVSGSQILAAGVNGAALPGSVTGSAVTGITLANAGSGGAHNNLQPSAVVLKVIVY